MQKLFEALYDKGITILNTDGQYDINMFSGQTKCCYNTVVGDYDGSTAMRIDLLSMPLNENIIEVEKTSDGYMAETPEGDKIECVFSQNNYVRFLKTYKDGTKTDSGLFPFSDR